LYLSPIRRGYYGASATDEGAVVNKPNREVFTILLGWFLLLLGLFGSAAFYNYCY